MTVLKTLFAMIITGVAITTPLFAFEQQSTAEVVAVDEIEWGHLNPARGDKSPAAADLWGDRTQQGATGFLVQFNKGFSSPEHIHNVTYRGVVISGFVHNDDAKAREMWLPAGSFWTQPAGDTHITAASGESNLAYIEIDSGPYLVRPSAEQFDNGERPINVDSSNLVWLDASEIKWMKSNALQSGANVDIAFLWGKPEGGSVNGTMVKLPEGFKGKLTAHSGNFRAIVIKGSIRHLGSEKSQSKVLAKGSYFGSVGKHSHTVSAEGEAVLYIRSDGRYEVSHHTP